MATKKGTKKDAKDAKRGRGRPPIPPGEQNHIPLYTKVNDDLHRRLVAAANAGGSVLKLPVIVRMILEDGLASGWSVAVSLKKRAAAQVAS